MSVICPVCRHDNSEAARVCAQCGLPVQLAQGVDAAAPAARVPVPLEPMNFQFDDEPAGVPRADRRDFLVNLGFAVVLLAVAGAAAWFFLAGEPETATAPASVPPAPAVASAAASSAASGTEPVEEIIESVPEQAANAQDAAASMAMAASAPASASAAQQAFTPVTVPRVPDAAPEPAPARPKAAPPVDAPWPPAPLPPGDSLARLRGALAQCAAMGNELSRTSCLARTRQNLCGGAWGRIPECPSGQSQ